MGRWITRMEDGASEWVYGLCYVHVYVYMCTCVDIGSCISLGKFMDICGFTPISEHYKNNDDPEGLVELVNKFLEEYKEIFTKL